MPSKVLAENSIIIVNGEAITKSKYNKVFLTTIHNYYGAKNLNLDDPRLANVIKIFKKQVVTQLIKDKLIAQAAKRHLIVVSSVEVEREMEKLKEAFPSEKAFQLYLSEKGMSEEDFKETIYHKLLTLKMEQLVTLNIKISEEEVNSYYNKNIHKFTEPEEISLQQIFVKDKAKAEEILIRLKQGTSFTLLAQQHSEDQPTAKNGGYLGYCGRGILPHSVERVVFSLNNGGLSPLLKVNDGYLIVKVQSSRKKQTLSYEKIKDNIRDYLLAKKKAKSLRQWFRRLENNADILFLDTLKSPHEVYINE